MTNNITKRLLTDTILLIFDAFRANVHNGSPHRTGPSLRGQSTLFQSIDLLDLALYYLNSRDRMYKMCPIFEIVPSSESA